MGLLNGYLFVRLSDQKTKEKKNSSEKKIEM